MFGRGGARTIVYVEDDLVDIYLINRAIQDTGESVRLVAFRDPADALAICRSADTPPDVVVLDINMPRIGGLQLLEKLKTCPQFENVPFVMFTTSGSSLFRREGLALGAASHIVKPVTYEGYPEALRSILALTDRKPNA